MPSPPLRFRRGCLAFALLALLACESAEPTRLVLSRGLSLKTEMRRASPRSFRFELRRDQFLLLRLTQDSLDVVLTLHPPDGAPWAPLDTQTVLAVPEILRVVAPREGAYLLEVKAADRGAEGSFRLEVAELRPATARDRLAVAAQNRLAEAEALRRRNDRPSDLQALPLYEAAVGLFGKAGDAGGEGYARVQWTRVLERDGRKTEAVVALRRCLALSASAQMPGTRARAATLLADALSDLGESAAADVEDRQALDEWKRLNRPAWEAKVINDLGHRAAERGELAVAEGLYRRALGLFLDHGEEAAAGVALGNLASVYSLAGEPRLALDAAERGLERLPKDAPPGDVANVLAQKGEALANLDRREESRQTFLQALTLLGQGAPSVRAQIERRLARRAYDQMNYAEAATRFRSALVALDAAQDRQSSLATRQDLAWTELKLGHLAAAEGLFRSLVAGIGSTENHWIGPAALAGEARIERARGHLEAALDLARRALDGVERLRGDVARTDLKASVFAGQHSYFDLAEDLLIRLYDRTHDRSLLVEAFEVSERSRARRLLDLLAAGRSLSPTNGTRAADELRRADERLKVLLASGAAAPSIDQAERQVRGAVIDLRREERPPAPQPSFGGTPLSLDQIQRRIGTDAVLLEFDLGEDASYLWVVSHSRLSLHRLPRQEAVEALARDALGVLSAPGISADSVEGRATLGAASKLLVGEAMPDLAARRWLVVMDGALHALPLGALPDPGGAKEPLLASHEIAYAPSASVAVRLSEREGLEGAKPRRELAVFADAVYGAERAGRPSESAGSSAPEPQALLLDLPRLSYSAEEARRILALVPPEARLDAERYDATKASVLSGELYGYRRLHFAVHGLPDENHPELSALALSLVDREKRPEDGILFAYEIARLRLPADLVVLSACKSGRGATISGEGLVGLAHAFFTAGAARVVASEWAVNDQATAELMVFFYDGLLRLHQNPARALQQAQLALARRGPWRRPYYWAAFVVQGGF